MWPLGPVGVVLWYAGAFLANPVREARAWSRGLLMIASNAFDKDSRRTK